MAAQQPAMRLATIVPPLFEKEASSISPCNAPILAEGYPLSGKPISMRWFAPLSNGKRCTGKLMKAICLGVHANLWNAVLGSAGFQMIRKNEAAFNRSRPSERGVK